MKNNNKNDYDSFTFNSKNPLARYAHRSRVKIVKQMINSNAYSLLDFGCGDGNLLHEISKTTNISNLIGFEPYMESKFKSHEFSIFRTWDEVVHNIKKIYPIEIVVCLEVMEHFSKERQIENLKKIEDIMDENSSLIISVPIEKGLASLVKNIRRVFHHYKGNENIYTLKNIICSVFGIKTLEMISFRKKNDYLPHMGFYFNEFENLLRQLFTLKQIKFSPFQFLPSGFNSQVFFELTKK